MSRFCGPSPYCERAGAAFKLAPDFHELSLARFDIDAIEGIPLHRAEAEPHQHLAPSASNGRWISSAPRSSCSSARRSGC